MGARIYSVPCRALGKRLSPKEQKCQVSKSSKDIVVQLIATISTVLQFLNDKPINVNVVLYV